MLGFNPKRHIKEILPTPWILDTDKAAKIHGVQAIRHSPFAVLYSRLESVIEAVFQKQLETLTREVRERTRRVGIPCRRMTS